MDELDRKIQAVMPSYGTNDGHGHVWRRPDGMRAKCGGVGLCSHCTFDADALNMARARVAGASHI